MYSVNRLLGKSVQSFVVFLNSKLFSSFLDSKFNSLRLLFHPSSCLILQLSLWHMLPSALNFRSTLAQYSHRHCRMLLFIIVYVLYLASPMALGVFQLPCSHDSCQVRVCLRAQRKQLSPILRMFIASGSR